MNPDPQPGNFRTLINLSLFLIAILSFIFALSAFAKIDPVHTPEAYQFGIPIYDHADFVEKIRQELQVTKSIELVIAPFVRGTARLEELDSAYVVQMEFNFYYSLTYEEQMALIAHELGHIIYNPLKITKIPTDEMLMQSQLDADAFSARHTSKEAIQGVLDKLYEDYVIRTKNLNDLKIEP